MSGCRNGWPAHPTSCSTILLASCWLWAWKRRYSYVCNWTISDFWYHEHHVRKLNTSEKMSCTSALRPNEWSCRLKGGGGGGVHRRSLLTTRGGGRGQELLHPTMSASFFSTNVGSSISKVEAAGIISSRDSQPLLSIKLVERAQNLITIIYNEEKQEGWDVNNVRNCF